MTALAAEVARTLILAVQQVRHYGPDHPAAHDAIDQFATAMISVTRDSPVRIEVAAPWLAVQSISLPAEDVHAQQLHRHLTSRRIQSLILTPGVRPDALATLVRLLAREPEELIAEGGLEDALRAAGASGLAVAMAGAPAVSEKPGDPYAAALGIVDALQREVERGEAVDIAHAHLVVESLLSPTRENGKIRWRWVASHSHDELDPAHAVNTCVIAMLVADALALTDENRVELGVAALLHDIGLWALPAEQRRRELTTETPKATWRHPAEGAYALRHVSGQGFLPMIVALEHHRPALGDAAILPQSKLIALVDYVDAMTCGRTPGIRQAAPGQLLTALLRGEGPRFDSKHVRLLAALMCQAAAAGIDPATNAAE